AVPAYFVYQWRRAPKPAAVATTTAPPPPSANPPGFPGVRPNRVPVPPPPGFPVGGRGLGSGGFPLVRGIGDPFQEMVGRYGAAHVATVHVENLPGDVGTVLQERLQ